ncbi:Holliday junction branch migration protein RuvA [Patescibacteria group bacterium]|nr:Holliday junction branch migration protein RuvA [Patescibacteria group bacterium]MBU4274383.1 Holliday junction branch migration protein RuvA [Patescibacteria group bacterium]MBU4367509.1 Holliday junction branch migration protein RuvA [Patescibacteria group bacterium]MBU4461550.1 Holliday junction branch migration protein RuvA [Patescibacteria group bacterium]MCG2699447.1 Holliday junction branch migration protein RuvA [Candidatus Parcubacteria bacterium]
MISHLEGKLILKREKFVIISVNSVGYKVFLSKKSTFNLPEIGSEQGRTIKLFCFQDVKETALDLYGFFDYQELEFFEILNDIRGIGPKVAIEIASLGPLEKLKDKILRQDETIFQSIPGIGQKRAMSIILELTGRINTFLKKRTSGADEVEDTLIRLGFSKQKTKEVISKIPKDIKDAQERVKIALQMLGQG